MWVGGAGALTLYCIVMWHQCVGWGMRSRDCFALSSLYSFWIISSIPDMILCGIVFAGYVPIGRHFAVWCVEVVALRTALGIGLGMNLNVVKDAAEFGRETVTFLLL